MTTPAREPTVASAGSAPSAPSRWQRLHAVVDFYCFEVLTSLRLPISLRAFQSLWLALYAVALLLVLASSFVVFSLVDAAIDGQADGPYAVLVIVLSANIYLGAGYVFREAFSQRRLRVANSPNIALFRALDISAAHVLVVYCATPAMMFFGVVLGANLPFVAVFRSSLDLGGWSLALLLLLPAVLCLSSIAVAAGSACRVTRPTAQALSTSLALGAVCYAVGFATARLLIGPIADGGMAGSFSQEQAGTLAAALGTGSAALVAWSCWRLAKHARALVADPFRIQVRPRRVQAAGAREARWGGGSLEIARILHTVMRGSDLYPVVRRGGAVLLMAVLMCLGVATSGASVLPVAGIPTRALTVFLAVAFVLSFGVVEIFLHIVGPARFSVHFRVAWELGLPRWRIALGAVGYYVAPVVVLGVGTTAIVHMLVGATGAPGGPLAVTVAAMSAALIAESVAPAPQNVDGSTVRNSLGALIALLIAVPVLAPLSLGSTLGGIIGAAYSACLLGGAIACTGRRILTLPLRLSM